ncbi:MAG: tripartite tricarboxylate transporter substrate binding protein [Burkholderiaceae bacterium]|jgi:tripartite-type tricarboxylate transporter receptor subunit TctC|nr:tripartite tricarboxylate transporter substrate binding protein [Burkholderiaceae bacterium]NBP46658.1 tripartite tricarboxylate transporter substrate binding protein [Burkholderiaceae bacterium]NBP92647.1 tripartite tricarboxylate transporter substrate binding protein [Burkholderiaceae bacterium]NBQ29321.1 tripartite tricarboxylate transporter substrate binding protein [Burkholderiaceae bacterium]NBS09879.1 tripartite tricarboxylate transporter substrate binding protein [Burkholderiaceae ba
MMHAIHNKKGLKFLIAATTLWAGMALAQSGSYPNKPIKFIVPYPPGGGTDVIARIVQEPLSSNLGQQVIIENRGGAGGSIGSEAAARSPADGYTVLFTLSSHTINPAIYPKLSFNTEKDFLPVVTIASLPQILVANPDFPAKNVKDVIDMAKAKPGTIAYASVGNGSPGHLAGAMMAGAANVKMTHIPYRGGGPAVTDVMGGQVPLLWVSIPAAANFVKAGKLKALAVSTTKRSAVFPDVPTMIESGFKDFEVDSWYAMFVPANTPKAAVDRLNAAANKVLTTPEVKEKLLNQGAEAVGGSPEALGRVVKAELVKWDKVVKENGIKAE